MEDLVVLLGAGASLDACNGSEPLDYSWRPPLAKDLFSYSNTHHYFDVRERHPRMELLWADLGPTVASGAIGVEALLRSYANHQNPRVVRSFKSIPLYLQELLWCVSTYYSPKAPPSTYLQLVKKVLADFRHRTTFVTLNYDTFLEKALHAFDSVITFDSFSDYAHANYRNRFALFKVHGSINWAGKVSAMSANDPGEYYQILDEMELAHISLISQAQPILCDELVALRWMWNDGRRLWATYPLMTAPMAGKGPQDVLLPENDRQSLVSALRSTKKLMIVGSSGLDEDMAALLNEMTELEWCDVVAETDDAAAACAARFKAGSPVGFGDARVRPVGTGFVGYMQSNELTELLAS